MSDSRDPSLLIEAFRIPFTTLIETALPARGFTFRPSTTIRTPWEQARVWRKSRSQETVEAKIAELRTQGAHALATFLEVVGPQSGAKYHLTKAVPGLSWHQWGEAADCYLVVNGSAVWDAANPGWVAYMEEAEKVGLYPGRKFGDPPHVQLRSVEPYQVSTLADINQAMLDRFGLDEAAYMARIPTP